MDFMLAICPEILLTLGERLRAYRLGHGLSPDLPYRAWSEAATRRGLSMRRFFGLERSSC